MSEETNVQSQSTNDTKNVVSDAKDTKDTQSQSKILGNQLGIRTREDIYKRFDAASIPKENNSDSSSGKEESSTEEDLKETSGQTEQHSENVEKDSGKSTPVKKGKETDKDSDGPTMVPLQALHESRDRFKKLNREYRDYKSEQEKAFKDLKDQVFKLQQALKTEPTTTESDFAEEEDSKVLALRREIAELKKRYQVDESQKAQEAALKAQQEQQKKLEKVTKELTDEGYPGFDIAVLKTDFKLRELANSGEITESEMSDPEMWKKVYKDHIYSDVKKVFSEQEKSEIMDRKKKAKAKANLIADPGKAPEKEEKKEPEKLSYDEFNKQALAERMDSYKKRFYKRR